VAGIIRRFNLTPGFDQKEFRVAEHMGQVVGCARLRFLGDAYELASLGVKESYHGRGVGTAVVRACLDAADDRVLCLTESPGFFERLGFRPAPEKDLPGELKKKMERWCPGNTVALVHGGNPVARTYRLLRDKCARDLEVTRRALEKVKIAVPRRSHYRRAAEDFLSMAQAYYTDGRHHHDAGDLVLAFACVNYAHGWLDAGARLGLFDVGGDDKLFTLAE
jgi:N-acetylglutamate synthase-like GNAT family acetyltransferase